MEKADRKGLFWKPALFGSPIPSWSYEPSLEAIEKVCRLRLEIAERSPCIVTFHASGCFNKLYSVQAGHTTSPHFLMRVSLPVDPHHKVRGEVATLRWVHQKTDIPVPKVICWDETSDNEIGFPWILMELMPGTSLYKRWRKMEFWQKERLVERVAEYEAQLLDASAAENFRGIGTLFPDDGKGDKSNTSPQAQKPGRIVDQHFFTDDHIDYDVPRGPFKSSHDWLATHLDITIRAHTASLDSPETDEGDINWYKAFIRVTNKLLDLLPKIFPSITQLAERTYLWHSDLNAHNILVDDDGDITAVLDWEFLSCQPIWVSTQTPRFLQEETRKELPLREQYADDDGSSIENDTGLDNEGKNVMYWEHLMEYETTRLRKVYNDTMEKLRPGWRGECADAALKRDFLFAAEQISLFCINVGMMEWWADMVRRGEVRDLMGCLKAERKEATAWYAEHQESDSDDDDESDSDEESDEESDETEDGSKAEDSKAHGSEAEVSKAEDAKVDDANAGTAQADDVKAGDAQADGVKADDVKANGTVADAVSSKLD